MYPVSTGEILSRIPTCTAKQFNHGEANVTYLFALIVSIVPVDTYVRFAKSVDVYMVTCDDVFRESQVSGSEMLAERLFHAKSVRYNHNHQNHTTHLILESQLTDDIGSVQSWSDPLYAYAHDLMNAYFGNSTSALTVQVDCITIG